MYGRRSAGHALGDSNEVGGTASHGALQPLLIVVFAQVNLEGSWDRRRDDPSELFRVQLEF
jgi:hypothetical protein